MLLALAQFYILINYYYTLLRTYQSSNSEDQYLTYTLRKDAKFQTLYRVSNKKPKFFLIQTLVFRSFRIRVIALFIQQILDNGNLYLKGTTRQENRIEVIDNAIRGLIPDRYLTLVDIVFNKAFTINVQRSKPKQTQTNGLEIDSLDLAFTTIARMLKEIELFITIRQAIRIQDVGHLRYAVDYLILAFIGLGQSNYSRKILYLYQLLSDTTYLKLQKAILTTSIINPSRKRSKAVALDKQLKLYNLDYSKDIAYQSNSIYNIATTFRKVVLNR